MATGVNNNAAVVVVGRTAPVPPGQQTSANSVPVVVASDQTAIPVEEQNKQQSEVALSLLGIPRSEVALGIFADVNTYDVNPTEWSQFPEQFTSAEIFQSDGVTLRPKYAGLIGDADWGLTHIAEEAGAMIEAPSDEYTILTSKRFFRYQPGRVSAATFGVKLTRAPYTVTDNATTGVAIKNPAIKKYGIFDKFDGYYFESRNDGRGDNFTVVRRTQSIIRDNPLPFGSVSGAQDQDYAWTGIPQIQTSSPTYPVAYRLLEANKPYLQELAATSITLAGDAPKCRKDSGLIIEGILHDLKYGGNASTVYNTLRFFNTNVPGTVSLYVQSGIGSKTANDEIARYDVILDAIKDIFAGNAPNTTRTTTPLTISRGGDIGSVTYVSRTTLGIPSTGIGVIESGASSAVDNLLNNILLRALGKFDTDFNYSSIPTSPTGSSAGELTLLRDGLVMVHAAAFDPSLLKARVNYEIVNLIDGNTSKYLKVKVPAGAELLQIGQGFTFETNGVNVDLRDTGSSALVKDGSIWYVSEFTTGQLDIKQRVETVSGSQNIYQYIRFSRYPGNEEIYGSGNTTNPWASDSTKAYGDIEVFDLDAVRQNGSDVSLGTAIGSESGENSTIVNLGLSLRTPTVFVLPSDERTYAGRQYSDETRPGQEGFPEQYVDGAFPYVYPPAQSAATNSVGYIDSVFNNTDDIKGQINYVNKRLYKNWVWFNVDPKYYKVYEYRVPRSRMSQEKLNGTTTKVVYSDNVLSNKAGSDVLDPTTNEQITYNSIWELDPTKVTMYKIEFSWYGAVGATFLAYVPVENNEARWVRVHHLRASNQLKVASLGNATLPITYMCYGGGNENAYGYLNADRRLNSESGYGSTSEQLTKYGASYYIDGGDRGTVRLFSYASETLKEIGGSRYVFDEINHSGAGAMHTFAGNGQDNTPGSGYVNAPYLQFNGSATEFFGNGSSANRPPISDYYMNAKVITTNPTDQDVRVSFVDPVNKKLYLTRTINATSGSISLVVRRPQPLVGIKCRTEINGVRNRVQIYPTRLATGVTSDSESLAVELIKTPAFQTFDNPGVGSSFAVSASNGINIGKRGKRILLPDASIQVTGGDYLQPGQRVYGWFRYTVLGDTSGQAFTTLGILDRSSDTGKYYFSAYEVTIDEIIIRGKFLIAGRWGGPSGDNGAPVNPDLSGVTQPFPTSTLARLSAIETDTEQRSPIPGTGTTITTIFSPNSGEEYQLSPYFDYNKDYLSFPLTDVQETLYICASSKSTYLQGTNYAARGNILASITWEEQ